MFIDEGAGIHRGVLIVVAHIVEAELLFLLGVATPGLVIISVWILVTALLFHYLVFAVELFNI